MAKIIVNYAPEPFLFGPDVFLVGPIQGAPAWQFQMIDLFQQKVREIQHNTFTIACPKRQGSFNKLSSEDYYKQIEWEHSGLERSTYKIIYLPNQTVETPGRCYAQTSRFEIGEIVGRHTYLSNYDTTIEPYIFVYIEPGFPNERYLKHTIANKTNAVFCENMEEVVNKTIESYNNYSHIPF
jgi:hypothetical protein